MASFGGVSGRAGDIEAERYLSWASPASIVVNRSSWYAVGVVLSFRLLSVRISFRVGLVEQRLYRFADELGGVRGVFESWFFTARFRLRPGLPSAILLA